MLRTLAFFVLLILAPTLAVAEQGVVLRDDCPPGF